MDRLTDKDTLHVAFDTWELCGLDNKCKRDCWKPTPCKIPQIVRRLAAYEDTGLMPDEIPHWIPVSESEEKPNNTVIGCDKWGNVEPVLYIPALKKWKIMPNACVEMDVIYWQPKPQPPKEKP